MKKLGFLLAVVLFSCSGVEQKNESKTMESIKQPKVENWTYSEDIDNMTSQKRYFAYNISPDTISFEFPYDGGSTFKLALRFINNENQLLVWCSKGQFISSFGENDFIKMKFDNEQPINVNYTMPSDGSTNIIFLDLSKYSIINKLKTSKKAIIEATFFNAGNRQIVFNLDKLNWQH